jgi:hypothetical protein
MMLFILYFTRVVWQSSLSLVIVLLLYSHGFVRVSNAPLAFVSLYKASWVSVVIIDGWSLQSIVRRNPRM